MAEAQDVEALKRRGRRRLVGAVALVLAAVIVLPMVFDQEPKPAVSPVTVRIPGEGEAAFTLKPAPKAEPPRADAKPATPKPEARPVAPKPEARAVAPKAEAKPAAPRAAATEYIFQVGVFANPENVAAKLKSAKVPYYTEPLKGKLTRVRAGPFPSREAADRAHAQMRKLGLEPGAVTARSG